jgi:hypothetical protein
VVVRRGLAVALDAEEEAGLVDGAGVRGVHTVLKQLFPDAVADAVIGAHVCEYRDDVVMDVKDGGANVCEDEGRPLFGLLTEDGGEDGRGELCAKVVS